MGCPSRAFTSISVVGIVVQLLACGPTVDSDQGSAGEAAGTATSRASTSTGTSERTSTTISSFEPSSSTAATTVAGVEPPTECGCLDEPDEAWSCSDVMVVSCDLEPSCPTVSYWCPRPNPDFYPCDNEYAYDEEALACALEALRDRTVGTLVIGGPNEVCGIEGCGHDQRTLSVTPTGEVVDASCSASPISASGSARLVTLAPAEHFAGCLELELPAARHQCLRQGLLDPVAICE